MRLTFSKRFISTIMLAVVVVPCITFAATLENPLKAQSFTELINSVLEVIIAIGVPIAALFFVYAGFEFVTSQGDPKKLDTAKSMFFWTCVGTALIVGANVVLTILEATINSLK